MTGNLQDSPFCSTIKVKHVQLPSLVPVRVWWGARSNTCVLQLVAVYLAGQQAGAATTHSGATTWHQRCVFIDCVLCVSNVRVHEYPLLVLLMA